MKECESLIQKALQEGRSSMLANEAQQICNLHNIPVPKAYLTSNVREAVLKAKEIGFPIALKIVSPQIIHKSDVGGVILNIRSEEELETQYEKMVTEVPKRAPTAQILGILVAEMVPPSTELIVGAVRDNQFGPSIMFGMGGIFTEIYNDNAFRVAPIDKTDAWNMIHELRGTRILEGARGQPPADIDAIISLLLSVSELMVDHDEISQLDLNPVMAYSDRICAVDTRIIIEQKGRGN